MRLDDLSIEAENAKLDIEKAGKCAGKVSEAVACHKGRDRATKAEIQR